LKVFGESLDLLSYAVAREEDMTTKGGIYRSLFDESPLFVVIWGGGQDMTTNLRIYRTPFRFILAFVVIDRP